MHAGPQLHAGARLHTGAQLMSPSPSTSPRSANSSSVVALIRSRAKSSCSVPVAIDHPPLPSATTGKPNCSPSGVPYSPVLATATDTQLFDAVFVRRLTTVSMAALAAEA